MVLAWRYEKSQHTIRLDAYNWYTVIYGPGGVYVVICGASGIVCVEIAIPECCSWFAVTFKLRSVPPRAHRYFWAPPVTLGPPLISRRFTEAPKTIMAEDHETERYERFDELRKLSKEGMYSVYEE